MLTIKITKNNRNYFKKLIENYDAIYGDANITIWSIEDLEELRKIGGKFINYFRKYL